MRYIKLYESFNDDKWILKLNESIFDKIEGLVKGKSEKGKIVEELLKKNGIPTKGSAYSTNFLGGADAGKKELSNPFDYLQYTEGLAKLTEEGVLVVEDEKAKALKVPDTISFLSTVDKEEVAKNFTMGIKPGSVIVKNDYEFDLSKDIPTLTMTRNEYSVPNQTWTTEGEPTVIQLDEDIAEFNENDVISFKTPMNMITLGEWVDKLNQTGWVKQHKDDYFGKYFQKA